MASSDTDGGVEIGETGLPNEVFQSLLRIGASFSKIRVAPNGDAYILVPDGYNVEALDRMKPGPQFIARHPTFDVPESFIDYVNEFKLEKQSRLFFDADRSAVLAVLDYDGADMPNRGVHRATFQLRPSDAWTRWLKFCTGGKSMEDTAEYLEENLIEVLLPVGADLLEMLTKVTIDRKTVFKKGVRLQDGTQQFTYNTEDDTGTVELPPKIVIGIPVFEGFDPYKIDIILRYRLDDGVLRWHFKPQRLDDLLKGIFAEIAEKLATDTSLPVYVGRLGNSSG